MSFIEYLKKEDIMTTEKGGRPKAFNSVKEMQIKIDKYFKYCDSKTEILPDGKYKYKPYTISGLCLFLKISKETFCEYQKKEEFSESLKEAKLKCENWTEEGMLLGQVNPNSGSFVLKNNFGWKDKTEVESTVNSQAKIVYVEKEEIEETKKHIDDFIK